MNLFGIHSVFHSVTDMTKVNCSGSFGPKLRNRGLNKKIVIILFSSNVIFLYQIIVVSCIVFFLVIFAFVRLSVYISVCLVACFLNCQLLYTYRQIAFPTSHFNWKSGMNIPWYTYMSQYIHSSKYWQQWTNIFSFFLHTDFNIGNNFLETRIILISYNCSGE